MDFVGIYTDWAEPSVLELLSAFHKTQQLYSHVFFLLPSGPDDIRMTHNHFLFIISFREFFSFPHSVAQQVDGEQNRRERIKTIAWVTFKGHIINITFFLASSISSTTKKLLPKIFLYFPRSNQDHQRKSFFSRLGQETYTVAFFQFNRTVLKPLIFLLSARYYLGSPCIAHALSYLRQKQQLSLRQQPA